MKNKVIVIFGSSRGDGDTRRVVDELFKDKDVEFIDLSEHDITYYDYEHKNSNDDYIKIVEKMVDAEVVVFATPVYWYSMSAVMKTFFDRFSDLIGIKKEIGRKLKGKKIYLIANGGSSEIPEFFHLPFSLTSKYLNMDFKEYFYHSGSKEFDEDYKKKGEKFVDKIFKELE